MKIITYNVNGIRAALKKNFSQWLGEMNADIVCLQEIKIEEKLVDKALFESLGYESYWFSAQKKGYSGTAILTKIKPISVEKGSDMQQSDEEGRVLKADFEVNGVSFSVINVYVPSGSSGAHRQEYKYQWLKEFDEYLKKVRSKQKNSVVCGDYNICHKEIDIHNPKSNKNSSGFLLEERKWLDDYQEKGMIDAFRNFNTAPNNYSWWTYRSNCRAKNLGWRIDYHFVSQSFSEYMTDCQILSEALHSDHCPVLLSLSI
jgi:exodeoxyribonuclease-3